MVHHFREYFSPLYILVRLQISSFNLKSTLASQPSKKLLFLDFDGVLHPTSAHGQGLLSKAPLLEAITDEDCRIILSTSWRFQYSLEELCAKLPEKVSIKVIGMTGAPYIGKHSRYYEIISYVSQLDCKPVQWRALDDAYWEFPVGCPELIRCNPNTGITEREISLLNGWLGTSSQVPAL
ncbi:hypothetical protein LZT22_12575 [Polynucleobacter sp. IMCC 29146]|nr:hypothetical protein [Polynucleobacter sp. IMCC 29146]